jgi:DNA-binding protein HU-beta
MTKKELAVYIAAQNTVSQTEAAKMVDLVVTAIREQLEQNQEVTIRGFGTFKPVTSAPRSGRNLRTQERVTIPAKVRIKFKSYMEEKEVV